MSKADRSGRDAERSARRKRRLEKRDRLRAERKAKQRERAAARARGLAERAQRKRDSKDTEKKLERSIEAFVDEVTDKVTEKVSRKTEEWLQDKADRLREGDDQSGYDEADTNASREQTASGEDEQVNETNRSRRGGRSRRYRHHRSAGGRTKRARSGRGLYRDSKHKKICGVCAGVADYLDVERWQVRLGAALGLIFVPSAAIAVYFIAYFLLDDKPYYRQVTDRYEVDEELDGVDEDVMTQERRTRERPASGMSSAQAIRVAKQKFADLEDRLRAMETHVTSSRFELQRELNEITADENQGSVPGGSNL